MGRLDIGFVKRGGASGLPKSYQETFLVGTRSATRAWMI
jgi:hypothetical protein